MVGLHKSYYQHTFNTEGLNMGIWPKGIEGMLRLASRQMDPEVVQVSGSLYDYIVSKLSTQMRQDNRHILPASVVRFQWGPDSFVTIEPELSTRIYCHKEGLEVVRIVGTPLNGLERALKRVPSRIKEDDAEDCFRSEWK